MHGGAAPGVVFAQICGQPDHRPHSPNICARTAPDLLPGSPRRSSSSRPGPLPPSPPHATTIVAMTFAGGVLMAGDRRATMGNMIASRHIEKVFPADQYSVLGIAGTAGIALDITRLFQVELEHYEKIEGTLLSLDGKANRLGAMVRGNLPMAMQGLAVVPLFAGFDRRRRGGPAVFLRCHRRPLRGAGAPQRGSGLGLCPRGPEETLAAGPDRGRRRSRVAVEALYDAADDDSATGGPDAVRQLWPVVYTVNRAVPAGSPERELAAVAGAVIESPGRGRAGGLR